MKRSISRLLFATLMALTAVIFAAPPLESSYCQYSEYDGTCWYFYDYCTNWCTWSCPWGDGQGPC